MSFPCLTRESIEEDYPVKPDNDEKCKSNVSDDDIKNINYKLRGKKL